MYEIAALFLALGMLIFTGYMWSVETDNADALRKENAELKREMNKWYNAYLDSESEMWSRVSAMQTNIAKRDLMIKELRDCSNLYDQCTVWECNC
jgi:hypothetical protein